MRLANNQRSYVRDTGGNNGWKEADNGSCPITFAHEDARDDILIANAERDEAEWSHDGSGSNSGDGWGDRTPSGAAIPENGRLVNSDSILEQHLTEISGFIDAIESNGLWVSKGTSPSQNLNVVSNIFSDLQLGDTSSWLTINFCGLPTNPVLGPLSGDYRRVNYYWARNSPNANWFVNSADRFQVAANRTVRITLPDDSNPHGGNLVTSKHAGCNLVVWEGLIANVAWNNDVDISISASEVNTKIAAHCAVPNFAQASDTPGNAPICDNDSGSSSIVDSDWGVTFQSVWSLVTCIYPNGTSDYLVNTQTTMGSFPSVPIYGEVTFSTPFSYSPSP